MRIFICLLLFGWIFHPATEGKSVAFGMFFPDTPGDNLESVREFEDVLDREFDIIPWYQAWGSGETSDFRYRTVKKVQRRGSVPMITWEPWDPALGVNQFEYSLESIVQGKHDRYIKEWARMSRRTHGKILLRFAHEMNGNWYPWATQVNGNSPELYIRAWKHVYQLFSRAGAYNVEFVWSPTRVYNGSASIAEMYPGDRYVDVVAIDGYNFGNVGIQHFRSFDETFFETYEVVTSLSSRPVMIGETGSSDVGGSRAEWIRQGLSYSHLRDKYPELVGIIYFNAVGSGNWPVTFDDGSVNALRETLSEWKKCHVRRGCF